MFKVSAYSTLTKLALESLSSWLENRPPSADERAAGVAKAVETAITRIRATDDQGSARVRSMFDGQEPVEIMLQMRCFEKQVNGMLQADSFRPAYATAAMALLSQYAERALTEHLQA